MLTEIMKINVSKHWKIFMRGFLFCRTTKISRFVKTRKNALDQGRTNRISLTHDLDLQSLASYGHDLLACKSSRSTVSRFRRQSGNKRTDGQTGGVDRITSRDNAVGNKEVVHDL